jgi:LPXTG-motif cell wall-anchored protein
VTEEVFSSNGLATDTTFGTADNAVSGGTETEGTFYARSMSFVQEAGGGFEIACQLLLPVGDYEFTNVFRLVASPDFSDEQVERFSTQRLSGARPSAATLAVPAATGDLDLVAEAGARAGTPVDEGSPTPTPTDTPTTIPSTGGEPLPQTGGSAGVLLGWGLLLVVAGVLMTVAARRRDNGARHVG